MEEEVRPELAHRDEERGVGGKRQWQRAREKRARDRGLYLSRSPYPVNEQKETLIFDFRAARLRRAASDLSKKRGKTEKENEEEGPRLSPALTKKRP